MELTHNVVGWFEIPVNDMERAIKFYETVFDYKLERVQMGPHLMAMFPGAPDMMGSAGSLVYDPNIYKPSSDGIQIYFTTATGDLTEDLKRVEAAGGKTIMPKTLITEEIGHFAIFIDSEGNKISLHSRK